MMNRKHSWLNVCWDTADKLILCYIFLYALSETHVLQEKSWEYQLLLKYKNQRMQGKI